MLKITFVVMMSLLMLHIVSADLGNDWTQATAQGEFTEGNPYILGNSMVVFNDKMWIIGGSVGGNEVDNVWSSNISQYGRNWTLETNNAEFGARAFHSSVVYDGRIWVIGGYLQSSADNVNDVWYSYNGVNWTRATSNAGWAKRKMMCSFVFNNKIYIAGGIGGTGGSTYYNDVWSSSDGINWVQETSSAGWSKRASHSCLSDKNGVIWLFGGRNSSTTYYTSEEIWTSLNGVNWYRYETQDLAQYGRAGMGSVVYGNRYLVLTAGFKSIGGSAVGEDDMYVFDLEGSGYVRYDNMNFGERSSNHNLVQYDGRIFLQGGSTADGAVWYSERSLNGTGNELPVLSKWHINTGTPSCLGASRTYSNIEVSDKENDDIYVSIVCWYEDSSEFINLNDNPNYNKTCIYPNKTGGFYDEIYTTDEVNYYAIPPKSRSWIFEYEIASANCYRTGEGGTDVFATGLLSYIPAPFKEGLEQLNYTSEYISMEGCSDWSFFYAFCPLWNLGEQGLLDLKDWFFTWIVPILVLLIVVIGIFLIARKKR